MYLSYQGQRLEEYTKEFFNRAEALETAGLIVQLGAFETGLSDEQ